MIKNPFKTRPAPIWNQPGRIRQIFRHERGARLQCESGWIDLMLIAPDAVRVRWRLEDSTMPPAFQSIRDSQWLPVEDQFTDSDDTLELATGEIACRVNKRQFRLRIELLPDRRIVCQDAAGIGWRENGEISLSMMLSPEEMSCGLGARASRLNLRGRRYRLWNSDPGMVKRDVDPLPFSYPFYLGVRENSAYGVLWDNAQRGSVDLTGNEVVFEAERGELSYVIFVGVDANAVMRRYLQLVGSLELPPQWALGYGQWTQPEFAGKIMERRIPTEAVYLSPTGDLSVLRQIIPHLRDAGIKVIVTLTPAVPITGGVSAIRAADGSTFSANGTSVLPDFTDIAAQIWWSDKLAALLEMGVDGFTLENAEPTAMNATGKPVTLPDDLVHSDQRTHAENHNLYSGLMAQATLAAFNRDRRPVIVSRSGGLNTPRSVFIRTGGSAPTWENLKLSVSQVINLSLSGVGLIGAEVNGDPELFTRWLQAMAFVPLLRGQSSPWAFGQPYELINRLTLTLRSRLRPYLYSLIAVSKEYGTPIIRPLFMLDPSLKAVDDCYLVGDILVAPVLEKGVMERSVTLPRGMWWYDYWSNELIEGGTTLEVTAALERLPLYVRAGTILPMVSEVPDTLDLYVFAGDGETVLYEDQGDGREFEFGEYRWVYMTSMADGDARLILTRRTAGRFQPTYNRLRIEVIGLTNEPAEVKLDRQFAPIWFYDHGVLEVIADELVNRIEITRRILPTDRTLHRRPW